VWTVEGALAALDTNVGSPVFRIPEDCSDDTGFPAASAACTFICLKAYPTGFDLRERPGRTGFDTGSPFTATADDDGKPFAHTPGRVDTDGRLPQAAASRSPGAGIHAQLTSHTQLSVFHRQFNFHDDTTLSSIIQGTQRKSRENVPSFSGGCPASSR